jgi:hypothetical protein
MMVMTGRKIILLLVMVALALSAGVMLGWVWTPLRGPPRPWFDELGLSTDQHQQIDLIWSETRQQIQKLREVSRHDLDRQRDQEVLKLLSDEQRAAYQKINDDYHAKRQALDKQRDALIGDANTRTRALLDDSQKKKWDILSKQMHEMHGRRGPGGSSTQRSMPPPPANGGERFPG